MKKLLVPTDFSNYATNAANVAIKIAKKTQAEVHFEHTVLSSVNWQQMSEDQKMLYPELKSMIDHAMENLDELKQKAESQGLKATANLTFNQGLIDIPTDINQHGYELVIMGSQGARGYEQFFIGSNAQRVIRYAPCPVLVVKELEGEPEFQRIAFASDFENTAQPAFERITNFTNQLQAKLDLVYVNTPVTFEATHKTNQRLSKFQDQQDAPINEAYIYNDYTPEEGILHYCSEYQPDLIAVATHGRKGLNRFFTGSITESLINEAQFPILSVNLSSLNT